MTLYPLFYIIMYISRDGRGLLAWVTKYLIAVHLDYDIQVVQHYFLPFLPSSQALSLTLPPPCVLGLHSGEGDQLYMSQDGGHGVE